MSEQPSLETMLREIEAIAAQLEQNTLSLEESLALYQRGAALVEQSRTVLIQFLLK
ncbi:MAG: exodeoxyribonuclease VII small subunit [Roseiflexaceae bacterium]